MLVPKSECQVRVPDLVIVPGLAFSSKGERLGQGGGYYDRYLKEYKGIKIGICFSEQLNESIPADEHDIRVDYVVDESGVRNCSCA